MSKYEYHITRFQHSNDFNKEIKLLNYIDELGKDGWNIFSVTNESYLETPDYPKRKVITEYTIFMKRKIRT